MAAELTRRWLTAMSAGRFTTMTSRSATNDASQVAQCSRAHSTALHLRSLCSPLRSPLCLSQWPELRVELLPPPPTEESGERA